MTPEIAALWALSGLDDRLARHADARAGIPARREAHAARISAERTALEAHTKRATALLTRRRELEREIAALVATQKQFEARLSAVTNNEQYKAQLHEIDAVKAKRSDFETEELIGLEAEEALAAEKPLLEGALRHAEAEAATARAALDREEAEHTAAIATLEGERAGHVASLEIPLRTRYERMRAARGGRAVVPIVKGACGGCFRGQPPHLLQGARKRDAVLICDGCGRMMILPPDAE